MTPSPDSLSRALDDAIGDGPPLPPVTDHLAPGRRAVRRRRTAGAVGAAAVVAVLGTTFALSTGGGPEVAPAPAASSGATPTTTTSEDPGRVVERPPLGYDRFGSLELDPGVRILDRIVDPVAAPPSGLTDALALRVDDTVVYYLMEWRSDGTMTTLASTRRGPAFPTLSSWVATRSDQPPRDEHRGEVSPNSFPILRIDDRGRLQVPDGVEVLRTIDNPLDLPPPRFSKGLVYRLEGKTVWTVVASLSFPGAPDVGAGGRTTLAGHGGDTLEDWIAALPRTPSGSVR